jgi:hypothetical protein
VLHEYLEWKFYGVPVCPECMSEDREIDLGPAQRAGRSGRGRRAHGGKLRLKCRECGHLDPIVLRPLRRSL